MVSIGGSANLEWELSLQRGAFGYDPVLHISPERDGEFPGQRHNADALAAAAAGPKSLLSEGGLNRTEASRTGRAVTRVVKWTPISVTCNSFGTRSFARWHETAVVPGLRGKSADLHSREHGFTLIELLIVSGIIGTVAAIAGTRMLRARAAASEASAVAALRVINSGEATFASSCAAGGYAIDLADLAKAPTGSVGFVSADLSANGVRKDGYAFVLAKSGEAGTTDVTTATCNGATATPATSYQANADAVGALTGRFFATDKRGTIFQDTAVLANPIPLSAALFR